MLLIVWVGMRLKWTILELPTRCLAFFFLYVCIINSCLLAFNRKAQMLILIVLILPLLLASGIVWLLEPPNILFLVYLMHNWYWFYYISIIAIAATTSLIMRSCNKSYQSRSKVLKGTWSIQTSNNHLHLCILKGKYLHNHGIQHSW